MTPGTAQLQLVSELHQKKNGSLSHLDVAWNRHGFLFSLQLSLSLSLSWICLPACLSFFYKPAATIQKAVPIGHFGSGSLERQHVSQAHFL